MNAPLPGTTWRVRYPSGWRDAEVIETAAAYGETWVRFRVQHAGSSKVYVVGVPLAQWPAMTRPAPGEE